MATREEIELALRSGISARRSGRFSEALQRMSAAAAMCGPDQQITRAHVLRELGELARNTHDLKATQAHYEEAIVLFRASGDALTLAHAIRHLATFMQSAEIGPKQRSDSPRHWVFTREPL